MAKSTKCTKSTNASSSSSAGQKSAMKGEPKGKGRAKGTDDAGGRAPQEERRVQCLDPQWEMSMDKAQAYAVRDALRRIEECLATSKSIASICRGAWRNPFGSTDVHIADLKRHVRLAVTMHPHHCGVAIVLPFVSDHRGNQPTYDTLTKHRRLLLQSKGKASD